MRYKFKAIDFWEELKAVTDKPCNIVDTGDEILFDFGDYELTSTEESNLIKLMEDKPLLRNKRAKFVEKGRDMEVEEARWLETRKESLK